MESLTAGEVRDAVGGRLVCGSPEVRVGGVYVDSRIVGEGEMFVAVRGARFDGHDFVDEAVKKKVSAVMVDHPVPVPSGVCSIVVGDTVEALGRLAEWYRRRFDATVVGVMGSNGKTTTKEMLKGMLGKAGRTVASPASFNNQIGVPLTLFRVDKETEYVVVEMGTSRRGDIAYLGRMVMPQLVVLTCVREEHLEGLGDLEGVIEEQAGVLDSLASCDGTLIYNGDDAGSIAVAARFKGEKVSFGFGEGCAFRCTWRDGGLWGNVFRLVDGSEYRMGIPGLHGVYNALAALCAARILGVHSDAAAEALWEFEPPPMRTNVWRSGGVVVVDDTYNANPSSFRAALDVLSQGDGRRIVVCGDMLEMGSASEALHRQLGEEMVDAGVDVLVCVGESAVLVGTAAVKKGFGGEVFFCRSAEEAAALFPGILSGRDIVLVKGSRAMRMELIVRTIKDSLDAVPSAVSM